jgi:hypothetical protein
MTLKFHQLVFALLLLSNQLVAQNESPKKQSSATEISKVFLDVSTGSNNPSGYVGAGVNIAIRSNFYFGAGVGNSTWGTKVTAKGTYFFNKSLRGGAFTISINHSTGFEKNNYNPITNDNSVAGKVDVITGRVTSTNLMYTNFSNIGKKSKFYFQIGYATTFNTPTLQIYQTGTPISNTDKKIKERVEFFAPGGIVANIGVMIALK